VSYVRVVLHGNGHPLDFCHDRLNRLLNVQLQMDRVGAGGYVAETLADHGLGQIPSCGFSFAVSGLTIPLLTTQAVITEIPEKNGSGMRGGMSPDMT
jgi:hypothetical protein